MASCSSPFSPLLLLALHVIFLVVAPFLITCSKSGFFAPLLIVVGVLFGASLVRVCGCVRVADISMTSRAFRSSCVRVGVSVWWVVHLRGLFGCVFSGYETFKCVCV